MLNICFHRHSQPRGKLNARVSSVLDPNVHTPHVFILRFKFITYEIQIGGCERLTRKSRGNHFLLALHPRGETTWENHKNKWESVGLMNMYNVVGVTPITYLEFGVLINIISKEDITYCVTIGDVPHCMCCDFTIITSQALGKKRKNGCIASIFIMCSYFCAR